MRLGSSIYSTAMHRMSDGTIRLKDGRLLGYAEYGDRQGRPVFFFHGTPGSRRMRHPDDQMAKAARVRLITVDRPGYGTSDSLPFDKVSQPVALWHGEMDAFANGHALASLLPGCRTTFLPEGHLLFFSHWSEILHQLDDFE